MTSKTNPTLAKANGIEGVTAARASEAHPSARAQNAANLQQLTASAIKRGDYDGPAIAKAAGPALRDILARQTTVFAVTITPLAHAGSLDLKEFRPSFHHDALSALLRGVNAFGVREVAVFSNINMVSGDDQPLVAYQMRLLIWGCSTDRMRDLQACAGQTFEKMEGMPIVDVQDLPVSQARRWLLNYIAQPVADYIFVGQYLSLSDRREEVEYAWETRPLSGGLAASTKRFLRQPANADVLYAIGDGARVI